MSSIAAWNAEKWMKAERVACALEWQPEVSFQIDKWAPIVQSNGM